MDHDPFAEGIEAHDCGKTFTANPYDPREEAESHSLWMDGWNFGVEQATDEEE